MKYEIHIDENAEERAVIYARERTPLVDELERLLGGAGGQSGLVGYTSGGVELFQPDEVECFISLDGKTYAVRAGERLQMKERLYAIEARLDERFVRLNQSCIANIKKIKRFEVTISASLMAVFESGYKDYVSRRQLKYVKERIGF